MRQNFFGKFANQIIIFFQKDHPSEKTDTVFPLNFRIALLPNKRKWQICSKKKNEFPVQIKCPKKAPQRTEFIPRQNIAKKPVFLTAAFLRFSGAIFGSMCSTFNTVPNLSLHFGARNRCVSNMFFCTKINPVSPACETPLVFAQKKKT